MADSLLCLIDKIEKEPEIYRLLRYCPYAILRKIRVKTYRPWEFELKQGEIYPDFYIIASGEADIFTVSEHGKKYFQTTYRSGDVIGEMEMFQQIPYISYVQAPKDITVLEIARDVFLEWIALDQEFNRIFIQKLCETSYQMFTRMGNNNLYSLKQRIGQYLLEQHLLHQGGELELHSDDLAQKMAVTRRSVNRIFKEFKEAGLLALSRGRVQVLNEEGLRRLANEKEKT
ncbi:Crp/Fnr family transcriptional regulator [Streptococcus cameli]